jgi:hypothetical protein
LIYKELPRNAMALKKMMAAAGGNAAHHHHQVCVMVPWGSATLQ